jgi:hypothetical protein
MGCGYRENKKAIGKNELAMIQGAGRRLENELKNNQKLLEVQEPFLEKVPGRRRH